MCNDASSCVTQVTADAVANLIMSTIPADAADVIQKEPLFTTLKQRNIEHSSLPQTAQYANGAARVGVEKTSPENNSRPSAAGIFV